MPRVRHRLLTWSVVAIAAAFVMLMASIPEDTSKWTDAERHQYQAGRFDTACRAVRVGMTAGEVDDLFRGVPLGRAEYETLAYDLTGAPLPRPCARWKQYASRDYVDDGDRYFLIYFDADSVVIGMHPCRKDRTSVDK